LFAPRVGYFPLPIPTLLLVCVFLRFRFRPISWKFKRQPPSNFKFPPLVSGTRDSIGLPTLPHRFLMPSIVSPLSFVFVRFRLAICSLDLCPAKCSKHPWGDYCKSFFAFVLSPSDLSFCLALSLLVSEFSDPAQPTLSMSPNICNCCKGSIGSVPFFRVFSSPPSPPQLSGMHVYFRFFCPKDKRFVSILTNLCFCFLFFLVHVPLRQTEIVLLGHRDVILVSDSFLSSSGTPPSVSKSSLKMCITFFLSDIRVQLSSFL